MDKRLLLLLLFALAFFTAIAARAEETFPPLAEQGDPVLQQGLERCLGSLGLKGAAEDKQLCVSLVDLTDLSSPRLAAVNGDEMMYAASLPKIAILLGAFERIARGQLVPDNNVYHELTRMIRYSSNQAANDLLNRVGKSFVTTLLQSPPYDLYDPENNGGLWIGKGYGKSPAWNRDPLHHLSHGATAFQTARFYYMLETGRLVSPQFSRQMKEILGEPAIHHKFVKGLEKAHPGSRIYRKSGTWGHYHADSAIVERDGRRYIAVALAHSPKGEEWLRNLIVPLDELIFEPSIAH